MEEEKHLKFEEIVSDLAGISILREKEKVADSALRLLEDYRRISLLGHRLLNLPRKWAPVYKEELFLFLHHSKSLAENRPRAIFILQAFGEKPSNAKLPVYSSGDLLVKMNVHFEFLEPVVALPDEERSLLPLHLSEITAGSERIAEHEQWLQDQENRARYMPAFLWELGATLCYNLIYPHLWDKYQSEPGILTILSHLLPKDDEHLLPNDDDHLLSNDDDHLLSNDDDHLLPNN